MVSLLDQDNHTVRMTEAQIGESLRKLGNPPGEYTLIPLKGIYMDATNPVLCFRPSITPKYSKLQMLHKYLKNSVLLNKKRKFYFAGREQSIIEPGRLVTLRVKGSKRVTIYA